MVRAPSDVPALDGCGMVVINPPYVLEQEMRVILPVLARLLGEQHGASGDVAWLSSPETSA
jgi:23S rRNA (adenine2030-N6)-methyltransferase